MVTANANTDSAWAAAIFNSFPRIPFVEFHREQLPGLVERRGHLVADDLARVLPLAFACDGTAFTWVPSRQGVEVHEGDDDAATVVELSEDAFSDLLHELLTTWGLERTGRCSFARGDLEGLRRWEPAIQALVTGREVYGPQVRDTLVDPTGAPLDLSRRFTPDDDADEMRRFFEATGYLHVTGVFSRAEVERYGAEIEAARRATTLDDPLSWWSVTASGEQVLTRINYLERHSALIRELAYDPRLARFAGVAGPNLRVCADRLDGPMVFIKNANVVKGNGDLGWHIDPTLGGRPVICPYIQLGIQLDHANAANGQLLVLAGSHRYVKHALTWGEEKDLPVVAFETEPGDLTIHDGYAMHTTPPPTSEDAGRRVLYYKFAESKTFDWIPAGYHYNDALFQSRRDFRVAISAITEY